MAVVRGAAVLAALLCFFLSLLLSPAPSVPARAAPTAQEVRLGRDAALQMLLASGETEGARNVRLSQISLDAVAALVDHGVENVRVTARTGDGRLDAAASWRLAARTWLNAVLTAEQTPDRGFPRLVVTIGQVQLPDAFIRGGLLAARWWARRRGVDLPPPQQIVSRFDATAESVRATVSLPRRTLRALARLSGSAGAVEPARLATACAAYRDVRSPELAGLLRAAFAAGDGSVAANRAALVAVAIATIGPGGYRLAGPEASNVPCQLKESRLRGRDDLAKHYSLSAALGATLDPSATRALGEWKELDDSLPGGSGFSFVDLAADRAGLRLGIAATASEESAARTAAAVAATDDADLLPRPVLALDEGLSDEAFVKRYRSLDAAAYAETVERIDAALLNTPLYR